MIPSVRWSHSLSLLFSLLGACSARQAAPTTPAKIVQMDTLRIVAKHNEQGSYTFDSYDSEDLFLRANAELDAGQCAAAVGLYDQLLAEFPGSPYMSAALYNAGLCLSQLGQHEAALGRFHRILSELPTSSDTKHASFQIGHLSLLLERWEEALAGADGLLARPDLDVGERLEAMATRAQALLGKGDLGTARKQAQQALSYYRTHPEQQFPDVYFVAAANFVLAETTRLEGEAMAFPDTNEQEQRAVLVRRAELLLEAQREYFNTMRFTNAHWAAAAGHRVGAMYDTLWHAIMAAPVPATLSAAAKDVYPQELAKLIKPLLRHAVRYWELTLMMVERTGVQTDWAKQTRADLERTRALLLSQPPGAGGLPSAPPDPGASAPAVPTVDHPTP